MRVLVLQHGAGVMLYVTGHEGRGIGLTNKIKVLSSRVQP